MDISTLAPRLNQPQKPQGDAYIRFQLEPKVPAVLSMAHTQEVVVIPTGRITPMPNMPPCMLGLLNWRSRVFWVIDLAAMLKLKPLNTNIQQYNMAIIRVGQVPLGLVVQEVKGVVRFTADCIQSPLGFVSPSLAPYLHGCVLQQKDVMLVLNAEAIVHSPIFQSN